MNHDLTTRAGQISHYAEVRARIKAAAYRPVIKKQPTKRVYVFLPEWKRQRTDFSAHVNSWRMRLAVKFHVKWLRDRCKELGLSYEDMTGYKKGNAYAFPRFRLIWEMRKEFPNISLPEIGRAFGSRDHTTVLHAIKRWESMRHEND